MNSFSITSFRFTSVLIAAFVTGAGVVRAQPMVSSLEVIAPFGFGTTTGVGLNNAGQVLVTADGNGWQPIIWTAGGGFTTITDTLSGGSGSINVGGINDAGQVTGSIGGGALGFIWTAGTMTEVIKPDGAEQMFLNAINNSGAVVGEVSFAWDNQPVFKSSGGVLTQLQAATGDGVYPLVKAINNAGQSVGVAHHAGMAQATLWDAAGNATVVTTPNVNGESYAQSINNNGVVVGAFTNNNESETAFIWDGENAINLGSLLGINPMQSSVANDVNDLGHVVGDGYGAFLYMDGVGYSLEALAADLMGEMSVTSGFLSLNHAYHINNLGQIVGSGTYYDLDTNSVHADMAFMLSLVNNIPEPSATAALAGLAALCAVMLRRRGRV